MPRIVGIDWATEAKNRALVVLHLNADLKSGEIALVGPQVDDASALAACKHEDNAVVAIDTPFGWPGEFASFAATWTPTLGTPVPPDSDKFSFRLTDRVVRDEVPKAPLSVSADRIAMAARAWAVLVAQAGLNNQIDTLGKAPGQRPTLIEVYPGASARAFGEPSYKADSTIRRRLVAHVASLFTIDVAKHLDAIVSEGEDSDETDAFLAAVTAAIYHAECTGSTLAGSGWRVRRPTSAEESTAAPNEGWIFFPVPRS